MVAHLHCTCFNEDVLPTSLSKNAIDYLRQDYDGVICSDDMVMQALEDFDNPCERAIRAGVNLFYTVILMTRQFKLLKILLKRQKTIKPFKDVLKSLMQKL